MRSAYEMPPVRSFGTPPNVASATGLGTGGSAGLALDGFGSGWGSVEVRTGVTPAASGNVVLDFGTAPPTLFVSGDEELGTLTVTGQTTTTVTVSFAGATMRPVTRYRLNFEWSSV